jgi:hypothetical protein
MNHLLAVGGAGLIGLAVLASSAAAQQRPFQGGPPLMPVRPATSPSLSPYLNMLRGGNPAANYYLGVVPEQQRRANEAMFGRSINQLVPRVQTLEGEVAGELTGEAAAVPRIPNYGVPSGFGYGPPPQFGRGVPGFGTPLPLPPAPQVPRKPMDKL